MPAVISVPYAPNKVFIKEANNVTSWIVLASDGVGYASLALLAAAGKVPWPGLDPGMILQTLDFRTEGAALADGSAFYYAPNRATAPTDTTGKLVSGAGQTIVLAGPLWNLWIRKSVGSDLLNLEGAY